MSSDNFTCPGCGRHEVHKMCPAHGTDYYMSGIPFTKEIEEEEMCKEASRVFELFCMQHDRCWICGSHGDFRGMAIHHICNAADRQKTHHDRRTLFRTCYPCHEDKLCNMPLAKQLGYKMLHDPAFYDRALVVEYKGRAPTSVTEKDVAMEVHKIFKREWK